MKYNLFFCYLTNLMIESSETFLVTARQKYSSCCPCKTWCPTLGPKCYVHETPYYGKTIVAGEDIPKGSKIYECVGDILNYPTTYTVQLDENRHINCTQGTCEFTCSSCSPNSFFEIIEDTFVLVALRDIKEGEQITFNYCTTEWLMATPFKCCCGNENCLGYVSGFSNVPENRREELIPLLTPYIREKALHENLITLEQINRCYGTKNKK
jgi:SET domain